MYMEGVGCCVCNRIYTMYVYICKYMEYIHIWKQMHSAHHDVRTEVVYAAWVPGLLQVVVEPPQEDLLWREGHEVLQSLPLLQQHCQVRAVLKRYLCKQTNLGGGEGKT